MMPAFMTLKLPNISFKLTVLWVFNHFKFVDTEKAYTYKDLLELATAVKKAWDYQGFLIDPLNSLKRISLRTQTAMSIATKVLPIYESSVNSITLLRGYVYTL